MFFWANTVHSFHYEILYCFLNQTEQSQTMFSWRGRIRLFMSTKWPQTDRWIKWEKIASLIDMLLHNLLWEAACGYTTNYLGSLLKIVYNSNMNELRKEENSKCKYVLFYGFILLLYKLWELVNYVMIFISNFIWLFILFIWNDRLFKNSYLVFISLFSLKRCHLILK